MLFLLQTFIFAIHKYYQKPFIINQNSELPLRNNET